jgi:hypothetical protein
MSHQQDDTTIKDAALSLLARLESRMDNLEKAHKEQSRNNSTTGNSNKNIVIKQEDLQELEHLRDVVSRQEYRIKMLSKALREADEKIIALGGKIDS